MMFRNKIMGHRGAAGLALENTLASMRCAAEAGASCVEFDVTLLADNSVVVHHDAELGRSMLGNVPLASLTLEELTKVKPRNNPDTEEYKIPTLREVLTLADDLQLGVNVEIKNHGFNPEQLVDLVLEDLNSWGGIERTLVSSFDVDVLGAIKSRDIRWKRAWITEKLPATWSDTAEQLSLYSIHAQQDAISPEWIEEAHQHNWLTMAWTVNDATSATQLLKWGLDGIITDYPNRMI